MFDETSVIIDVKKLNLDKILYFQIHVSNIRIGFIFQGNTFKYKYIILFSTTIKHVNMSLRSNSFPIEWMYCNRKSWKISELKQREMNKLKTWSQRSLLWEKCVELTPWSCSVDYNHFQTKVILHSILYTILNLLYSYLIILTAR